MIKVTGIPYDANSSFLKGPAFAPARIRLMDKEGSANSFSESVTEIKDGVNYTDVGDLVFENTNATKAFDAITNHTNRLLEDGSKIISLGGDHSISYPIIGAFAEKFDGLNILHLDAHGDLYENFDDNPYSHASPFARIMETRKIHSLTQVGIRTQTTHLKEQAKKFGVTVIDMINFNFDFIKNLPSPLYVSLDIDVLDPAFAPGISHHEPGGLSTRELLKIIQLLHGPSIVGADIVEYNPSRDINNATAMVAYKLLKELIAKMSAIES